MAFLVPASEVNRLRERGRSLANQQRPKSTSASKQRKASDVNRRGGGGGGGVAKRKLAVLIVGASGRTGSACIRGLVKHPDRPHVHAFCRNPAKLESKERDVCASVIAGDMRCRSYLATALAVTQANVVILNADEQQEEEETGVRTVAAHALVNVLMGNRYTGVRLIVVSSANVLRTDSGHQRWAISRLVKYKLRGHVPTKDYREQEHVIERNALIRIRSTVVRPTIVSEISSSTTNGMYAISFSSNEKAPTTTIHPNDLGNWIAQEAITGKNQGCVINLTSARFRQHKT